MSSQWALPHLIANRLRRRTDPHHSRRGHLNTSFYIGAHTRVLALRFSPRALRRSPGCLHAVVQLDAVCDPGGTVGTRL